MVVCTSGNAIIVKDNGNMIGYKYQCRCGYVDNQVRQCSIVSGRVTQHFTFYCGKCRQPVGGFEFQRT